MKTHLPHLAIVPVEQLVAHEHHDDQRAEPLYERLAESSVLRNPPIISPIEDGSGKFVVLDGANRTIAFQKLGYPHILCQIVRVGDPGIALSTWNHVIWDFSPDDLLGALVGLSDIRMSASDPVGAQQEIVSGHALAVIQLIGKGTFAVQVDRTDLEVRIGVLNKIVDLYKDRAMMDRTAVTDLAGLADVYPNLCGLMIFPPFEPRKVLWLASRQIHLPAGITRFTISPRALRINYPMDRLREDAPLDEKNEALAKWTRELVARKSVRYYAEHTVLFDE